MTRGRIAGRDPDPVRHAMRHDHRLDSGLGYSICDRDITYSSNGDSELHTTIVHHYRNGWRLFIETKWWRRQTANANFHLEEAQKDDLWVDVQQVDDTRLVRRYWQNRPEIVRFRGLFLVHFIAPKVGTGYYGEDIPGDITGLVVNGTPMTWDTFVDDVVTNETAEGWQGDPDPDTWLDECRIRYLTATIAAAHA